MELIIFYFGCFLNIMKKVGFVGWRGMVGSVLVQRMLEEGDFNKIYPVFFTTSQFGKRAPRYGQSKEYLRNAFDYNQLKLLDVIVSCQGEHYTRKIYSNLRKIGWSGYWLDTSSVLRMKKDSIIVLDPINYDCIVNGIKNGVKNFVSGNCVVNLMLIALGGLFKKKLIEWISFSTYQAASGAGSYILNKLFFQIKNVNSYIINKLSDLNKNVLFLEKRVTEFIKDQKKSNKNFEEPLFSNLIPWIDKRNNIGQSREEYKIGLEINKILNSSLNIPIDGICVRVSSFRCHSQSLLIKLKKNISIRKIENIILSDNSIIDIIPNEMNLTIDKLNPISVSGKLKVLIGRLRKLNIGKKYLSAFIVGDQLLWGASEPIRRVLLML